MYENAVPVYEMKNRLSYYLHKVDTEGPVYISVRGKPTYVIQTIIEAEEQKSSAPKEKNLFEVAAELRKQYGIEDDDDFDFTEYLESIREEIPMTRPFEEHMFDED